MKTFPRRRKAMTNTAATPTFFLKRTLFTNTNLYWCTKTKYMHNYRTYITVMNHWWICLTNIILYLKLTMTDQVEAGKVWWYIYMVYIIYHIYIHIYYHIHDGISSHFSSSSIIGNSTIELFDVRQTVFADTLPKNDWCGRAFILPHINFATALIR